jgi:uncharacterized integral membrane protein (TIGR00697 family)
MAANSLAPPSFFASKRNKLFVWLSGFFICNALLAEIIGTKIFSLEQWLGTAPAQLSFFGFGPLSFNLTCGALIWPFVFISTDIINEYYGLQGVRRVTMFGTALISYMFLIFLLVTNVPPAQFWLDLNNTDPAGHPFNIEFAYRAIFRQGLGIIFGSVVAFLLGQFLDAYVFQLIKARTGDKFLWLRATGSTIVSQLLDSFVVLFIAFFFFGNWSFNQVLAVGIINYIYKFSMAVLLSPLLYLAHNVIDKFLAEGTAEQEAVT